MGAIDRDRILEDTYSSEARAEGVTLERRCVLKLSAATIAAALTLGACRTRRGPGGTMRSGVFELDDGALEIEELLTRMYPLAQECVASGGSREEAYLTSVCELVTHLRVPDSDELMSTMIRFARDHGGSPGSFEFFLVSYDLEPGKGFTHHDHRDYNGVIFGLEGEVRCRNYDILGNTLVPPKGTSFQIRQTRDDVILPGRFSTLGRRRDNVHEVVAGPEGGKVLDVFTYFEPGARSYYMDVESKPRDAVRKIYDASWK